MIDELADWRPPGSQDLPRAVLLAMLGRFDEAWPLAEARSSHLREVTGNTSRDAYGYLALIATIEGDRERAVQYGAEEIEAHRPHRHPGGDGQGPSRTRALLPRTLRRGRATPRRGSGRPATRFRRSGDGRRRRGAPARPPRPARAGGGAGPHGSRHGGDQNGQRLVAGVHARGPRHRARARRTDRRGARGARAIPRDSGSGRAACRVPNASASRSSRSAGRRSDLDSRDIPAHSGRRLRPRRPICRVLPILSRARTASFRGRRTAPMRQTARVLRTGSRPRRVWPRR